MYRKVKYIARYYTVALVFADLTRNHHQEGGDNMKHYSIAFYTTNGSRRSIRVNNPNVDIPLPTLVTAVDQMLANDVYDPQVGGLESLSKFELSVVERTVLI